MKKKTKKTSNISKGIILEMQNKALQTKLKCKYIFSEAESIYLFKKAKSPIYEKFLSEIKESKFWDDVEEKAYNNHQALWFFNEVGLGDNPRFCKCIEDMIKEQSVEGYIQDNECDHVGPMRTLVATKPESDVLNNAINYWLKNWKKEDNTCTIASGILTLTELDFEKYSRTIQETIDYLNERQNQDGSWGMHLKGSYSEKGSIIGTGYSLWAICRVKGINSTAQKGLNWLLQRQKENGSWENNTFDTNGALLGILAGGGGPKVDCEVTQFEFVKLKQKTKRQRPIFLHTSPMYKNSFHVKEIHDVISKMLHNAQKEIRIASPYIDMFYEDIINLTNEKPNLTIKIITRPKALVKGLRERIARNVVDLLDMSTKGNVITSSLVHSRIIIIDDVEALISSADLTRDQLFDEFNAGIWTADRITVKKAIDFFENLFELERKPT